MDFESWRLFQLLFAGVVQLPSCVWFFVTLWTVACRSPLSSTISWSLLKFTSIESVILSNHLILCHPLFLVSSIFPSIRVFSKDLDLCIMWPNYWSSSFSISPSNEYSGLISFMIDCFDLFAVQGPLKTQSFFLLFFQPPEGCSSMIPSIGHLILCASPSPPLFFLKSFDFSTPRHFSLDTSLPRLLPASLLFPLSTNSYLLSFMHPWVHSQIWQVCQVQFQVLRIHQWINDSKIIR